MAGGVDDVERDALASSVFLVNEVHGIWGKAIEVPGIKPLPLADGQSAGTTAISCAAPDRCSVGGYRDYANTGFGNSAFVDSQP